MPPLADPLPAEPPTLAAARHRLATLAVVGALACAVGGVVAVGMPGFDVAPAAGLAPEARRWVAAATMAVAAATWALVASVCLAPGGHQPIATRWNTTMPRWWMVPLVLLELPLLRMSDLVRTAAGDPTLHVPHWLGVGPVLMLAATLWAFVLRDDTPGGVRRA